MGVELTALLKRKMHVVSLMESTCISHRVHQVKQEPLLLIAQGTPC